MSYFRNTRNRLRARVPGLLGVMILLASGFSLAALEDDIRERMQPPGEVCMMGDSCAEGMAVASASDGPMDTETIYNTYCNACHANEATGAPVLGNAEMWAPRIDKGIEALYDSAINGVDGTTMMAKGTCTSCSDEDLRAVVDYMVEAVE